MVVRARVLAVVLSLSIGLTGSGCSILFAKGPPERVEPHEPIHCSKSYALPVVDGLITGLQVARTLYAFSLTDQNYNGMQLTRESDIAIGVGLSGLFLISTMVGTSRVSGCNELLEKVERPPEPRRIRPGRLAPSPPSDPDDDADVERAQSSAAADAKAAGEAAGASQPKPEVIVAPAK